MAADLTTPVRARPDRVLARLFALAALTALAAAILSAGKSVYRTATDSFVAPIILSPDNDAVIAGKLSLSQLELERAKTASEIEAIDADAAAGRQGIARLQKLAATLHGSLGWSTDLNRRLASSGAAELKTLSEQRAVLESMLAAQRHTTDSARANLDAGLVSNADYAREAQALSQLEVALLENSRTRAQSELQQQEVQLARSSLASRAGVPALPELIVREDQSVRIELETLRLESEQRAKLAERRLAVEKLAKIDELETQLRARPLFRAAQRSLDVAFVPYTQIDGVQKGADVYSCTWGLFHCKQVGTISEVVPGEVILPDPWGNQARGQYAILELRDRDSAKAKTLRVRAVR